MKTAVRFASVILTTALAVLCIPCSLQASNTWNTEQIEKSSTGELEQRLEYIEDQLTELADFQVLSGMGPIGFRSNPANTTSPNEWIQIDFDKPERIDQIVIVPTLWRNTRDGPQADAFPIEFQVIALDESKQRTVVAAFSEKDQLVPRIAPVAIDITPQVVSSIRIETTKLSNRAWDQRESLQLSEVMVFNGADNVALHQTVTSSSSEDIDSRKRRHLVDGFLPYMMELKIGEQSTAFLISYDQSEKAELTIDLGEPYSVNQINLHALETSDTIPQTVPSDYAFPRKFIVKGSLSEDFTNAERIFEYQVHSVFDTGPILMKRFPVAQYRYIRITVLEPYLDPIYPNGDAHLSFAEIEVIADGVNVARGKTVHSTIQPKNEKRKLAALTDGHNFFGAIIPVRDWLEQLNLRHQLERERPLIEQALKRNYARQRAILNQLIWLVVVIVIIAVFATTLMRLMAQRSVQRLRERIAADLHDELGANLHAIGLLSDLSEKAKGNPNKLSNLLQRIRTLTLRTGAAARHCTNMLEAEELYSDVAEHFQRVSRRLLNDMRHDLSMEGSEHLVRLSPRRRIDLCMFYQECLTNILRHSEASQVSTVLRADKNRVTLTISDNGVGLNQTQTDQIPKSISRRSRLLGSKLSVDTPAGGGTRISLTFNLKRSIL